MKPKIKKLSFTELWELLRIKYPELTFNSLRREVRENPERFGAVRRNPIKDRGRGGKFYFDPEKVRAYAPYQKV